MNFQETDIDFTKIDWLQFEELCFDLLIKYQFHDLIWHQGGADSGRDIEATNTVINSMTGAYPEKWFFECKFYSAGVPMNELVSKLGWAEAHRVKHFVLITNTYPTKSTREYLELMQKTSYCKMHVVDGKALKRHLLSFPDIVVKYFADDTTRWVKNLLRQWVFQDTLPDVSTFYKLSKMVDPSKLDRTELLFLFLAFKDSGYDEDFLGDEVEPFNFDFLIPEIKKYRNSKYPIDLEKETGFSDHNWSHFSFQKSEIKEIDLTHFAYQDIDDSENLQLFLMRANKQTSSLVTYKTCIKDS